MNNPIPTDNTKATIDCPCCGGRTLRARSDYDICHRCGWENDPASWHDPDNDLTANHMSLTEARRNTEETGTHDRRCGRCNPYEDAVCDCSLPLVSQHHYLEDFFTLLKYWKVRRTD